MDIVNLLFQLILKEVNRALRLMIIYLVFLLDLKQKKVNIMNYYIVFMILPQNQKKDI